jgi:hypothetical protein
VTVGVYLLGGDVAELVIAACVHGVVVLGESRDRVGVALLLSEHPLRQMRLAGVVRVIVLRELCFHRCGDLLAALTTAFGVCRVAVALVPGAGAVVLRILTAFAHGTYRAGPGVALPAEPRVRAPNRLASGLHSRGESANNGISTRPGRVTAGRLRAP